MNVSTVKGSNEWQDRIKFQMSENESTNLQTAVWGLSIPLQGQDATRRTLELTIESSELETFLNNLDENNIMKAVENAPNWFKKSVDESSVRQMYVKMVKEPGKVGQNSTVRVKVNCGEYPTKIYVVTGEKDGNLIVENGCPDDLQRNVKCLVMVQTVGLWFMSRQFGMSLSATEIMVWPNKRPTGIDAFTLSNSVKFQKSSESNKLDGHSEDAMDDI